MIKNHTNNTEIFSGYYLSFIECIEDAVNKNIDLTYIDLKNKNLSNASLDSANMSGALLSGANLTGANLSEANLEESIFYNCSLYNTCLSYSNLKGCDFRNANFGATLIEGSDIQECIFSTLSCFDLDFYFTENMDGCLFASADGALHKMSKSPVILKGFLNNHIIILDNTVKIGAKTFPREILPKLIQMLSSHALPALVNDNNIPYDNLNNTKNIA